MSRHNIVGPNNPPLGTDVEAPPSILGNTLTRSSRLRGRKSHLTRSSVAFERWSSVRDHTNRKHCPSHEIWSYERDGRWYRWSFDRGSTVAQQFIKILKYCTVTNYACLYILSGWGFKFSYNYMEMEILLMLPANIYCILANRIVITLSSAQ